MEALRVGARAARDAEWPADRDVATVARLPGPAGGQAAHRAVKRATVAVVDEAAAASDIHLCMVATQPKIDALLLVGDEKQLPPFVKNPDCRAVSTFARCAAIFDVPQLNVQYRMPEDLATVISAEYYDARLETCPRKLGTTGVTFLHSDGAPTSPAKGHGLINRTEAMLCIREATEMRRVLPKVAILTFYNQQKLFIQDALRSGGTCGADIEVLSVDSAQGHEFSGVVLSCVARGKRPGFVKSANRLCVALSRAQERLTVVCSPCLMRRVGVLKCLHAYSKTSSTHMTRLAY